jgi:hypothetical protein
MLKRRGFLIHLFAILGIGFYPFADLQSQTPLKESGQPDGLLVHIVRSGGFAGLREEFRIFRDGRVVNSEGTIRRIAQAELQPIARMMTPLDLPNSCQIDLPKGLCSDCYYYQITFRSPSGARVLTLDNLQMEGHDNLSKLAKSIRDLVSGLKWK